jgi:hypothetical protein
VAPLGLGLGAAEPRVPGGGRMTTFVLVHGGWHGGWCWKDVAALLTAPAELAELLLGRR